MKNVHTTIAKAVAATVLASLAGFAAAADTQNLTVTATISPKCKFVTGTPTVAFGAIDPSGTTNATATASVLYKCTTGTTPGSLAPTDTLLSRTMSDGTNSLAYTLSFAALSAGAGFSSGKEKTVVVTGTITPAQFNDAVASTGYTETVGMTITP